MADVHSKPSCLVHFKGETGFLTRFTDISLEKFLKCHELWLGLDGEHREIADNTTSIVTEIQTTGDLSNITCHLHYHRSCYSKFTNRTSITRAQTRCAKRQKDDEISNHGDTNMITQVDEAISAPPKKSLRSVEKKSLSAVKPRNQAVLPPICIICNEEHKYINDPVSLSIFLIDYFAQQTTFPEHFAGGEPRIPAWYAPRFAIHNSYCKSNLLYLHHTCKNMLILFKILIENKEAQVRSTGYFRNN